MKKIIYTILFTALTTGAAFAQDEEVAATEETAAVEEKEEKGESCCGDCDKFPKAGDIGLSINSDPLFQYVTSFATNMFGTTNVGSQSTPFDFNDVPFRDNGATNGIFVRYFLEDDMVIRATFATTQYNSVEEANVQMDGSFDEDGNLITQADRVTDTRAYSETSFGLGAGVELRRNMGKSFQGYYGGELLYTRTNGNRTFYEYGNDMTAINYNPITSNFAGGENNLATRTLEFASPTTAGVNLSGILGLEWYVTNRVSLGTELKWGYFYTKTKGNSSTTVEYMEQGARKVEEILSNYGSDKSYGFAPQAAANLWLNIYF